MNQQIPGFFITRLIPRRLGDGNLRGTFIGQVNDIRQYDNAADYRSVYDETIWNRNLPSEIVLDFGQPPKADFTTEKGAINSILKPSKGDILILVHGSRSSSGDKEKRRGLIGLAQVEDVYFYEGKNLNVSLNPLNVDHFTWSSARCSLRASVLAVPNDFLITPNQLQHSSYYVKSGLSSYESALGISSASANNVTDFFADSTSEGERKQRITYLLSLFIQNDSTIRNKLQGSSLEEYMPTEVISMREDITDSVFTDASARNRIFFGSPGSGKSRTVRVITQKHQTYTTTFHPDYDYTDLAGAYKPVEDEENPGNITYRFEPNVLTNAYVEAWKNPGKRVYVVIEEINRGNCAQIFGDLFLLLDRDAQNNSDYILSIGSGLSRHFKKSFVGTDYASRIAQLYETKQGTDCTDAFSVMAFPPNLYLYATMNTSDQSLFPMDSAFKRRWDWEYVPIDYADADQFVIDLGTDYTYRWGRFIECVNRHIVELTGSEDKQLGNRFVSPPDKVITMNAFKSKIMFYLWSEIYKNEHDKSTSIFVYQPANKTDVELFTFSELFQLQSDGTAADSEILPSFMRQLGLEPIPLTE